MKTSMSIGKMMMITVVFLFVCGFVSAGNEMPGFVFKTQTVDGLVVEKIAYFQGPNGELIPAQKYVYTYNQGEVIARRTFAWNKKKDKWVKRVDMTLYRNKRELVAEKKLWNGSGNLISHEKMVYLTDDDYKECYPQFVFIKDLDTKKWVVKNDESMVSQN